MLKSFINPQKILGNTSGTVAPEAFSNFMTGNDSVASNSEQNSPANNISDFSRVSKVEANVSNLQSLISTISQNITNNFNDTLNSFKSEVQTTNEGLQTQIQNISTSINNNFNNTLNSFKSEVQTTNEGLQTQIQNISTNNSKNTSNQTSENNNVENNKVLQTQIQNISTSINTNVNNSISNTLNTFKTEIQSAISGLQNQTQSNLTSVIQNFTKDYQQKIQSKEDNKPSNVLKGFLGLYQNAINFVTFFGDSKNNKRIENSLKGLRNMFNDSFNTALIIRQTIVKIVKQLSNLPSASASSGGLNLDVKVPGGPLKQVGGSTIGKFVKGGAGRMLGVGAAGLGVAGLGIMGMQAAKATQEEKLAATAKKGLGGEDKSNGFMEGMNNIIERFSDAIDSLLGGKKKSSEGGGGGASSGGSTPGGGTPTSLTGSEQQKTESLLSGYEGFRTKAYKDSEGIPTIGYGQTRIKGRAVQMGDEITKEEGLAGLRTNIESHRSVAIKQVGQSNWEKLPENTRVALTSIAYNYGSIPNRIMPAVKSGDSEKIAQAIEGLSGDNRGVNTWRRKDEAMFIRTGKSNRADTSFSNSMSASQKKPPSTVTSQAAKKPPSKVKPAPPSTSKIEPSPRKPEAQKVSQAVTTPPGQDANKNMQIASASLPADITVIPGGGEQEGGGVIPPPPASGESAAPDVSMYGMTANLHNPYWSLQFNLGILNA